MVGRWHALVLDCPIPRELADFYQSLLGMIRVQDEAHWVVIGDAPDRPGLAFQQVEAYQPPTWPMQDRAQQMHVDVRVQDLDAAVEEVLNLGAEPLPGGGENFRVFADPVGHPFCLVAF
jgi:catechol 2,3-dioxygenase-like lactoylglutathione lyase family enzyme